MATRQCEECGTDFEPKRSDARFHGDSCRKKAARKASRTADSAPAIEPIADGEDAGLITATTAALDEAGVVDTVLGQLALVLARDLAHSRYGAGSHASLAGRLQLVMDDALAGHKAKQKAASKIDNIRGRSARKRANAAGLSIVPDVG